jgi:imidazolonepropionase-like amidohydrolase
MNIFRLIPALLILLFSCNKQDSRQPSYSAFIGATLIDGSGAAPIENAVLLIQDGRVVAVGSTDEVDIPEGATIHDMAGKTIIPGIINGHGHVGEVIGIEGGHYSTKTLEQNLSLYARYGITTVVSLGGDKEEAVPFRAINDSVPMTRARLYIAGEVVSGKTPEEALAAVERNHQMGVDFMKIRVDDNVGTSTKMSEEVYQAVIQRSHELGYAIATHMYYLEDSKKLLEAGSDLLAHSIRDLPVDEELINLIKAKGVAYCPTLTRELSTYVYEDTAAFFSDPFFLKEYDPGILTPLLDPSRQQEIRNSHSAQTYKKQLPTAYANLKTLSEEGVPIVFGTDSGVSTRFMGYFEHLEMEMMAEAGMTPMEIIVSATKNAAEYLNLKDLGTLSPGHWADFLILDADPLEDIRNVRKMTGVYIGGVELE